MLGRLFGWWPKGKSRRRKHKKRGSLALNPSQVSVIDADTIKIGAESIRLVGFDAPELGRAKSEHEYNMGVAATKRLQELLGESDEVRMQRLRDADIHGRSLAPLYIDGRDVADIAVEEGWGVRFDGDRRRSDEMPDWDSMRYPQRR